MKKKVAIIGVTGAVGQEFVLSLEDHPWFEVTQIAASERSAGKDRKSTRLNSSHALISYAVFCLKKKNRKKKKKTAIPFETLLFN